MPRATPVRPARWSEWGVCVVLGSRRTEGYEHEDSKSQRRRRWGAGTPRSFDRSPNAPVDAALESEGPGGKPPPPPQKAGRLSRAKMGFPEWTSEPERRCLNVPSRQDTSQTGGRGILPDATEGSDERDAIGAMRRAKQLSGKSFRIVAFGLHRPISPSRPRQRGERTERTNAGQGARGRR
jgi:hypothetical protein